MKFIGITGGVGSGKTQVLEYLNDKYGKKEYQKTRKAIFDALGVLLETRRFENITVQEVVKDEDILEMDAQIIEKFIAGDTEAGKKKKKIELDFATAMINSVNDECVSPVEQLANKAYIFDV